jgi:predicted nucleotidyltransferase
LRTGLAQSSVREGLLGLQEMRIVDATGFGRAQLFQIARGNPLAAALFDLFEAEDARFRAILESIRAAAESFGPKVLAAWLYGSVARGEDRWPSDLDIAVVADRDAQTTVQEAMFDKLYESGEELSFRPSVIVIDQDDVRRNAAEDTTWWKGVVADSLVLLGSRPEDLAERIVSRVRRRERVR